MKLLTYDVDVTKLLTRAELLDFLEEDGASDRSLAKVRERYMDQFGNEMVWRYPISDGMHTGTFIVCVQEGFISLPYDVIDAEDYEMLELQDAAMYDAESMRIFIEDWETFSKDLTGAMQEMLRILSEGA